MSQDDLELNDVIDLPHGRLERYDSIVEWRGQDGARVHVGIIEDFDRMVPTLQSLGLDPPPAELLEWCWSLPLLTSDVD